MTSDLSQVFMAYDIRGTVPEQLNEEVVRAVGAAFARVVVYPDLCYTRHPDRPAAVVGHDMRSSSESLAAAFMRGLNDAGVEAVRVGLCSTDALYFASGSLDLPGAMVTTSHIPSPYNGLKLCRYGARPVSGDHEDSRLAKLRRQTEEYLYQNPATASRDAAPEKITDREVLRDYAQFLRSVVDLGGIRPLKIVVDAGNGVAGLTAPAVLGTAAKLPELPVKIVPQYFDLDGAFPNHEPNPLDPRNLVDLQKAVIEHRADIGVAFDGDADRCVVVDELGNPVSPSAITALIGLRELARQRAVGNENVTIIHNLITSRAVSEFLSAAGAQVLRTRVGHSFIKAQMAKNDAVFGGEHSAHYYFRDFFYADTGMLAAMHVLSALGSQPHPLSALAEMYEPYAQSGEINLTVDDVSAARDRVVTAFIRQRRSGRVCVDDLDGLTVSHWDGVDGDRWWFSLRSSNTEPLLRLNVEAMDRQVMERIRDDVLSLIRGTAETVPEPLR